MQAFIIEPGAKSDQSSSKSPLAYFSIKQIKFIKKILASSLNRDIMNLSKRNNETTLR